MILNDSSSALSLLETRRSGKPRELVEPGPSRSEIDHILTIAMRTPDHGKIAPWRFVVIDRNQRQQLADLLARALPEHVPEATSAHYAKSLEFAHQAPAMIVLISSPIQGHKIPVWEQELSCGAVAMAKTKSNAYGTSLSDEEPITDPATYRDAFERIEKEIFVRQAVLAPVRPATQPTSQSASMAPANGSLTPDPANISSTTKSEPQH